MRRRHDDTTAPGEDSFLDVVANLVGILVILIMVVGMRARGAYQQAQLQQRAHPASAAESADHSPWMGTIEQAQAEAQALLIANRQAQEDQRRMQAEIVMRQVERDQLNVMLAGLQREVTQRRELLDRSSRQKAEMLDQLDELQQELARIHFQIDAAQQTESEPVAVDHVPTPLAKTVFGLEEHFRLKDGRLAYVPLNSLLEKLKQDARHQSAQLQSTNQITSTLGPEEGFRLRYTLARRSVEVETKSGPRVHEMAQLTEFELLSVHEPLGMTLEEALSDNSPLRQRLAEWKPRQTVITIWTYPDSYEQFRQLKQFFEQQGFLTAARPLPDGQPISGSPNGSHSAAQ